MFQAKQFFVQTLSYKSKVVILTVKKKLSLPSCWLVGTANKQRSSPETRSAISLFIFKLLCFWSSADLLLFGGFPSMELVLVHLYTMAELIVVCRDPNSCWNGILICVWSTERVSCSDLKTEFPSVCVRNFPLTHWGHVGGCLLRGSSTAGTC